MERLDFEKLVLQVEQLGTNAQTTLMYRLVQVLGPGVLRTTTRYCFRRLDQINAALPESSYTKVPKGAGLYVDHPRPWRGQFHELPGIEPLPDEVKSRLQDIDNENCDPW